MENYKIGVKVKENLKTIEVNDFGDTITVNTGDTGFFKRFADMTKWISEKVASLSKLAEEKERQYGGRPMTSTNEDGELSIDVEQLSDLADIQVSVLQECTEQIDKVFGEGTMRKYFRLAYENLPGFVPDEDCIADFMEEITPVMEELYHQRAERLKYRYDKKRKPK